MHFILLKYIHNIMRYMCFYKNRLNLPRSPLSHYKYFRQVAGKYFNFKTIFYQVNYNFSGKPPYFPATCLQNNNFIGDIPLQLDIKMF